MCFRGPELKQWLTAVLSSYIDCIHHTFPVLARTKARVQSMLAQCPVALQNAFTNAFLAMVRSFMDAPPGQDDAESLLASHFLSRWEMERHPRSRMTDLVHLQTLIMMVIEADYHGVAAVKGLLPGPPKSSTLGRAAGVGYSMRLHLVEPSPKPDLTGDQDSDENIALRAWWSLVVLDRWTSIGTASPLLISTDSVVILPGLRHIVGDAVYRLIRKLHHTHCIQKSH